MAHSTVRRAVAVLFAALGLLSPFLARAGSLPQPTGKPILTVTGKIAVTNDDGKAIFDRQMIEALGETSFSTSTPWYDGAHKFEGVPLARLLDTVGAAGDRLVITALNDYVTEIPGRGRPQIRGDPGAQARRAIHAGERQGADLYHLPLRQQFHAESAGLLQALGLAGCADRGEIGALPARCRRPMGRCRQWTRS